MFDVYSHDIVAAFFPRLQERTLPDAWVNYDAAIFFDVHVEKVVEKVAYQILE